MTDEFDIAYRRALHEECKQARERAISAAHDLYNALDRLVEAADQAEAFHYDASALADARVSLRTHSLYDGRDG